MSVRLAISTGDPAGIGPEISQAACEALLSDLTHVILRIYGDARLFSPSFLNREQIDFQHIACPRSPRAGCPTSKNAPYVIQLIEHVVDDALQGRVKAIVTAPIAKAVLYEAGFTFPGHTEFLGHLAGGVTTHMMLWSEPLCVVPVTLHQSLKSVIEGLNQDSIRAAAQAAHEALRFWFGVPAPRLVVCGLNPHAGERGAMGFEDKEVVHPAVEELQRQGLTIEGPLPADTLFHAAARKSYDCALGLYHDQVLIPLKALAFDSAVNLTLGLPFIRTSPDHGTAFDIAGKGIASVGSMLSALRLAAKLAK